jgi:alkanesulfonate monooxygenase SsuD/methylene tetrahydromethanopterin reductase-like flavin-dependent oxidoreductase (luciferase family)
MGGVPGRFRRLMAMYRRAGAEAGHDPATLAVGVHCFGFVAETDRQAADAFWPGYQNMMIKIGRERGFAPPTRPQYEAMRGEHGAFFIGNPDTVAAKIVALSPALGGITRFTMQMTNSVMAPEAMLSAIELLGREVKPRVHRAY